MYEFPKHQRYGWMTFYEADLFLWATRWHFMLMRRTFCEADILWDIFMRLSFYELQDVISGWHFMSYKMLFQTDILWATRCYFRLVDWHFMSYKMTFYEADILWARHFMLVRLMIFYEADILWATRWHFRLTFYELYTRWHFMRLTFYELQDDILCWWGWHFMS